MKYLRYENVGNFLKETLNFLGKDEVENNLMLGICTSLKNGIKVGEEPPFLRQYTMKWNYRMRQ